MQSNLGQIDKPTEIYRSNCGDHRLLTWTTTEEDGSELVITTENLDTDPSGGGWFTDDFIQIGRGEAEAVREAIDTYLAGVDGWINTMGTHGLTEDEDKRLLIQAKFDEDLSIGWALTDEYGEEIWISETRLTWLATLLPQLLAAYKKNQRSEEVGNA
jgi:hypothetical protein